MISTDFHDQEHSVSYPCPNIALLNSSVVLLGVLVGCNRIICLETIVVSGVTRDNPLRTTTYQCPSFSSNTMENHGTTTTSDPSSAFSLLFYAK